MMSTTKCKPFLVSSHDQNSLFSQSAFYLGYFLLKCKNIAFRQIFFRQKIDNFSRILIYEKALHSYFMYNILLQVIENYGLVIKQNDVDYI